MELGGRSLEYRVGGRLESGWAEPGDGVWKGRGWRLGWAGPGVGGRVGRAGGRGLELGGRGLEPVPRSSQT